MNNSRERRLKDNIKDSKNERSVSLWLGEIVILKS